MFRSLMFDDLRSSFFNYTLSVGECRNLMMIDLHDIENGEIVWDETRSKNDICRTLVALSNVFGLNFSCLGIAEAISDAPIAMHKDV